VAFTLVVSLLLATFVSFFTAVFASVFSLDFCGAATTVELRVIFEDFVALESNLESVYSSGRTVFSIPVCTWSAPKRPPASG
jgi:hypothetical protein